MLYSFLLVLQVVVAIGLVALVLIQHGRGADAGAAFGSGASGTVFGSRGSASFLSRTTAVLATLFFVTSLALANLAANRPKETSVLDGTRSVVVPEETAEGATSPPSDIPDAPVQAGDDRPSDVPDLPGGDTIPSDDPR